MELRLGMVAAYGALVTVVIGISKLAGDLLTEDAKRDLGEWLSAGVKRSPETWVRDTNRVFVRRFDRLYGGHLSFDIIDIRGAADLTNLVFSPTYALRIFFWGGLFVGVGVTIAARVGYFGMGISPPSNGNLLLVALALGFTFVLVIFVIGVLARVTNDLVGLALGFGMIVVMICAPFAGVAYLVVLGLDGQVQVWRVAATSGAVLVIGGTAPSSLRRLLPPTLKGLHPLNRPIPGT